MRPVRRSVAKVFVIEPEPDVETLSSEGVYWHLDKYLRRVEEQLGAISDTLDINEQDLIRPWHAGRGILSERNWRVWASLNTLEATRDYLLDTLSE